jgi:ferredoxin-NADP reductase
MASEEQRAPGDDDEGRTASGQWRSAAPDIDVAPPQGNYPISRGAPERKLERVNRYDRRAALVDCQMVASTGTVSLTFEVVDDHPFLFHPGYFIAIQAEAHHLEKQRSPYCITSPPNGERTFRLLIRQVQDGQLSDHLCTLAPGDMINFRGPSGRSMVPKRDADELLLLATGVGIGPILALCPPLLAGGFEVPVRLFWGLRLAEDVCLVDELDALASAYDNFEYQISLSQPPPGWTGLRGRLTESVPGLLRRLARTQFYLVGNGAMIEEMATVLSDLGVDQRDVYQEAYFNSRYRPDACTLAEIRSRFVASDLFSPFAHLEAGLYMPAAPLTRTRSRSS